MPEKFIYETAITIDHETGVCLADTTVRGIASQLVRRGFEAVTKPTSAPYRRFRGEARQVAFRPPKGKRPARGFALKKTPRTDVATGVLGKKTGLP